MGNNPVKFSYKQIWFIAYPILISLVMEQLIGMTDTAFMGRVGEVELGASAIAGVYYMTFYMIAFGFSLGAQIIMGRRNGEGNYAKIGPIFYKGTYFLLGVIIRKTKCSSVLKQNVLFYKTKRTSVNLFSYPNWHKKAPKKYVFFGAFYCSVFWLSHQKSLTLNKYIIFGFNAILIPLKRRYIIPPESWARHRLYSIMSVYVAL